MQKKSWYKESVVYQIYPRSFMDSNGDGIGDIRGIIKKLDYLKNLGVDIIWISPIYESPNEDNGYDISDYQNILSEFGTMEDFDKLLETAHDKGMKIIMDLVVNHTSDEHQWFVESRKSKDNSYRDYYIWKDGKNGKEPNNWGSWFGGSAWQYDENTEMYYLHIFSSKQPDLNWDNNKVRNEVYKMMKWWLDKGIDGFRMDVINLISKDHKFPDGKSNGGLYGDLGPYCLNGEHVHEYLKEMNENVLSKYDIMTVGETADVTIEEAKKYSACDRNELDMVFQFEHMALDSGDYGKWSNNRFNLIDLKKVLTKWQKELEEKCWNTLFWSNHDQPRAVSRFGNDKDHREISAKMLGTCLYMMRGTPFIFQGEELGMTNAYFDTLDEYRDLETFNAYEDLTKKHGIDKELMMDYLKHISRDNARTPMQWDDSTNAGFTTGTPWISVNKNYPDINANNQVDDHGSVYNYYRKLFKLRHEHEIIVYGDYKLLEPDNNELYVYTRSLNKNKLLVICNFTQKSLTYEVPEEFRKVNKRILISNYHDDLGEEIRPYEAKVYMVD
ncbi:oligo-1,6-glucosidase [Vallitalea longa]|uniref:Oligo-1,6-glucosidase n=1 Tax=Vallitalea longa TaxID=2936439 RepID=A0A9W6DFH4_9FIRM|nr:oligo-1,6-glucosidase [Vallitalea longa]